MDILRQLNLTNPKWFLSSFNRSNLKFSVLPKKGTPATLEAMKTFIRSRSSTDSGIIYCLSRKECDEVAKSMSSDGIRACAYHAGLTDSIRESRQKDWITNKFRVICATVAFGMGIDKPDVRLRDIKINVLEYCRKAVRCVLSIILYTLILITSKESNLLTSSTINDFKGLITMVTPSVIMANPPPLPLVPAFAPRLAAAFLRGELSTHSKLKTTI
uniref:DNA 3'-5' helicase n=1 Tax=Glossina brevipalpis TaxID=37001 RepID=A0A1A9WG76_9MUSC